MKQRTLATEIEFEGIGVHSGSRGRLLLRPALPDSGLRFRRCGMTNSDGLKVSLDAVAADASLRRTVLRDAAGWSVETPEHVLSTCIALGISNLILELDGPEVPFLDGSALPFAEGMRKAGIVEQDGFEAARWTVDRPLSFRHGDAEFAVLPSESELTIACFIAFPGTVIDTQSLALRITGDGFVGEVAPARTFVLESDIAALRERGLIKGGTPELAVVAGRDAYLNPPLRFADECVRHKILDFLGDLALVGGLARGHFMVVRAGHASHLAFNLFLRKEDHLRWIHPPRDQQCHSMSR